MINREVLTLLDFGCMVLNTKRMSGVKQEAGERVAKEENTPHTLVFLIPYWKFLQQTEK
jgi:hypothetical protein